MVGVGIIFTHSSALQKGFDEFGAIVKLTIEKAVIPLLPWYIFTMICEMSAKGVIAVVLGSGFKIILTGIVLSVCYLFIQYCVAAAIARKNPFKCLWNMLRRRVDAEGLVFGDYLLGLFLLGSDSGDGSVHAQKWHPR